MKDGNAKKRNMFSAQKTELPGRGSGCRKAGRKASRNRCRDFFNILLQIPENHADNCPRDLFLSENLAGFWKK